jgi:hypothetical protein
VYRQTRVAFRRFFIGNDLQLGNITRGEDQRGTCVRQHGGQPTTIKAGTAGEEDGFALEGKESRRHGRIR